MPRAAVIHPVSDRRQPPPASAAMTWTKETAVAVDGKVRHSGSTEQLTGDSAKDVPSEPLRQPKPAPRAPQGVLWVGSVGDRVRLRVHCKASSLTLSVLMSTRNTELRCFI